MNKYRFAIMSNEVNNDHQNWIEACEKNKNKVEYKVINMTMGTWLDEILAYKADFHLLKPGGRTQQFKNLYEERSYIISKVLGLPVFPSFDEVYIYENKRMLSYYLSALGVPHPATYVFYSIEEANLFAQNCSLPIVGKLNIGAAGSGITIIRTRTELQKYITNMFNYGISNKVGPRLLKGNLSNRIIRKILHPAELIDRLETYRLIKNDVQSGFLIFQEYIPHNFEWRVVRIGNSFFAHRKIKKGEKASGTLKKQFIDPPKNLLNFVKNITDRLHFYSQAIDIFESSKEPYLINEMQCIFGQAYPYQMLVEGKPGQYKFYEGEWQFEEGLFNTNSSFDLRLQYVLEVLFKC